MIDSIAEYIQTSYPNNESGIVYCFSRKECEQVCGLSLLKHGHFPDYIIFKLTKKLHAYHMPKVLI